MEVFLRNMTTPFPVRVGDFMGIGRQGYRMVILFLDSNGWGRVLEIIQIWFVQKWSPTEEEKTLSGSGQQLALLVSSSLE